MSGDTERKERMSAVITGCTSGLGRSLFLKFADEGWFVTGCGRRVQLLQSLTKERGDNISVVPCDIRLENHVISLRNAVRLNPGYIDILILNAGAIGEIPLPQFRQANVMELRKLFETNVFANFNVVQQLLPLMKTGGTIVHITSDASRNPYGGWSGYGASKAAFNLAVDVLNVELRDSGIMAINIDPGDMNTEMHRLALPDADIGALKHPDKAALEIYERIGGNTGAG